MLTKNRSIRRNTDQALRAYRMADGVHIFDGAFVGLDSEGLVQPLHSGDRFVGIALEEAEAVSLGPTYVRVWTEGDFTLSLPAVKLPDTAKPVFALDDEQLTLVSIDEWSCVLRSFVGWAVSVHPDDNMILLRLETSVPWGDVLQRLEAIEARVGE